MTPTIWWGCYDERWGDELTPEAFAHPAKVAPGLSRRIYDHAGAQGWLKDGDTVIDPFGGIAGFALQAMAHGLTWVGVDVEQKFVDLGNANIALWNSRYSRLTRWGRATLIRGDSRKLVEVVSEAAQAVVSSPPYADGCSHTGGPDTGQEHIEGGELHMVDYGDSGGQLAEMKIGDFDATVSSPPYTGDALGHGGDPTEIDLDKKLYSRMAGNSYGGEDAQLGQMKEGDFDAAVSSPPYESSLNANSDGIDWTKCSDGRGRHTRNMAIEPGQANRLCHGKKYGDTSGQVGSESGEEFWSAAKLIAQQTYLALRPGGHAIWVVKSFVRNRQIVDFPDMWRQLCEACGFRTIEVIHAMLISEAEQLDLFGGNGKRKERKSFFRRLAENKGSPKIDYEVVLCMEK